ncbi:kelch-like protein diablo [Astyanax mexicanus]|uniref:kelch-like protein diablo n=1 Tax=Astyanax mexicanus TaxID=7994 RepID=UPI0020CAD31A|nr:kelch-like protein diablo [Astyanax mexicanus]
MPTEHRNHRSLNGQCKGSPKRQSSDVVYVVGGWSKDNPSCQVEQFCSQNNEWKMTKPMLRPRKDVGVCAMGGLIYIVGGADDFTCVTSVDRYDPERNSWCGDVAPLTSARSRVCVLEMDGFLVTLGGYDGTACTNAVERYDPEGNCWSKLAPMLRRRAGAAAAVLDGHIYVVGGNDGDTSLDSVERFGAIEGVWSLCPPMLSVREGAGCCVYLGCVYVAGGRDEFGLPLCTVEKYDPHTGRWSPARAMRNKRYQVSLVVFDGLLLAIGGSDGVSDLKTMEAYDPEANSWRHFGSMKSKHPGGHVALVKAL